MVGLAAQESGDPNAVNVHTGAHGAWQVMPVNWPKWAKEAGLSANAPKTADNQRKVVRAKLKAYFIAFGSWDRTARAWYGGPGNNDTYSNTRLDSKTGKPGGDRKYPSFNEYAKGVLTKVGTLPCDKIN